MFEDDYVAEAVVGIGFMWDAHNFTGSSCEYVSAAGVSVIDARVKVVNFVNIAQVGVSSISILLSDSYFGYRVRKIEILRRRHWNAIVSLPRMGRSSLLGQRLNPVSALRIPEREG